MRLHPAQVYVALLTLATLVAGVFHVLPALTPVREEGLPGLSTLLAHVDTQPQRRRVLGYEREEFGPGWGSIGACTTREAIMVSHFDGRDCHSAGSAPDLYTGHPMNADDVEIDHVIPLSAAWDLGAYAWDDATRVRFANDPTNLVATASAINQDKSDQLPSAWLPPDAGARCWYSRRVARVAASYALALPEADVSTMRRQCRFALARWSG
ncbi:HNH endonuclease family protein [Corynebacterium doosanense]|uniref:GmrSD restriction endonucleases C-terminal domain-containing protein n=1 Tax=Corynebacterium doosanense CAU 212 = DSM 45436 TaxID=558173 RepID=A0A097IF97_9CORY|nr:HNH endonuclease family protein [Corynebacterium doosanense]AIT60811.1 hypothetical protein CDOO_05765 [Corynebacterium doosanense CAU 212 = DSM 45436]